jgi:hypothetical protein
MKKKVLLSFALIVTLASSIKVHAQDEPMRTLFKSSHRTTAYGALTNKFTEIDGEFVNLVGVYGGVYLNRRVMIGIGAAASTNNLPVPTEFSSEPLRKMSYEYVQFGSVFEFVAGSNNLFHPVFHLFAGPGLTFQYDRYTDDHEDWHSWDDRSGHDENWFFVTEPGVQIEMNVFKWMRFSPGVSYRFVYGNDAKGLSDSKLSGMNVNLTLKFGKF